MHSFLLAVTPVAVMLATQTPDTSLATLVNHLRQTELRSGGWRHTMVWQPHDSLTADFLRATGSSPHETILPVGSTRVPCPGSSDATGTPIRPPVGYTVRVQITAHGTDSAMVQIDLGGTFVYQGRSRGFSQGKLWEAVKGSDGWRVALRNEWIT